MPFPLAEIDDHIYRIVQLIDLKGETLLQKDLKYEMVLINLELSWKWVRRNYVREYEDEAPGWIQEPPGENHHSCNPTMGRARSKGV
jgi:hypothetical protein